ncbi:hypothetical protein ACG02S_22730 [Roseateles sp. DC23W]|uniref:Uncharacterized protein n=1 Tax=Pelomonas dachongensis TaxID=3299029 RepID=A0ABW7EUC1_9BURK
MNPAARQTPYYAAARRLGAALPWPDLPFVTCGLPAAGSLLVLIAAGLAILAPRHVGIAFPLLWGQALLLAYGANRSAAVAHERLLPWERRVAPLGSREVVRGWLLSRLGQLGGLGAAGPLALGVVLDAHAGEVQTLPGVAALLAASLCGGLVLGLGWCGRAPRWLVVPAAGVLALLLRPSGVEAVVRGEPLVSLLVIGAAGLAGAALVRADALRVVASPLPRPRLPARWRRNWLTNWLFHWRSLPMRNAAGEPLVRHTVAAAVGFFFQSQVLLIAHRMGWLAWGQPFGDVVTVACGGLCLFILATAAALHLSAPSLHWRHRLAPRGLTTRRWVRQLVWGSLLTYAPAGLLMLTIWLRRDPAVDAGFWASVLGDLMLTSSVALWSRGCSDGLLDNLRRLLGAALAAVAMLCGLNALGLTPQRGAVWLMVQAGLVGVMTILALRAWARRDINALACNG